MAQGFPSLIATDSNQFSYGPKGEMAPESALKEAALNRRRQIANLLIQKGLAGAGPGQMAGRFYVPTSPLQHVNSLLQTLVGAGGNWMLDKDQEKISKDDQQMVLDAIKSYQERMKGPEPAPPMAPPAQAAPPPMQGEPMPPAPQQGPYNGEVGGIPAPEVGVQSEKPPIQAPPPPLLNAAANMPTQGIAPEVTPGDMSQFAQAPQAAPMPPEPMPQQAPPPMQAAPAVPRKTTMDDLVGLLTHQHPQVRAYGQLMAAMTQKQQDREAQQEFLAGEKSLDRDLRREAISENARAREAQMKQNMILTQMQIDSRLQQGHDANDLKKSLSEQANELQKLQMKTTADLKKAEIGSRADMARQHDETLKAIAGMNIQGRKDVAEMKADPKNRPMDATAKKELIQTEEELQGSRQAIENLRSALAINDKAMGFTGAGAVASAGSLLPDAIRPKSVDATVDLDNLITASALPQLKAIFGGMPTEGERKILLDVQGSSAKTPAQRKAIFERAIQAAENRIKFGTQKAEQIRSGQYFSGEGGLDTTVAPNPGTQAAPKVRKYNPSTGKIE